MIPRVGFRDLVPLNWDINLWWSKRQILLRRSNLDCSRSLNVREGIVALVDATVVAVVGALFLPAASGSALTMRRAMVVKLIPVVFEANNQITIQ